MWAYASDQTPGSRVTVVFPKDYTIDVEAGELPAPTVDDEGRTIYKTGRLDKPLEFFAYFVADRPGAYVDREVEATVADVPVGLTVRHWKEDAAWGKRVGGLFERGLPQLSERIGLPWPREEGLVVQESVSRSTGGYAGLFDPTRGHAEVAYYADDFVVLHEAAHAWFNGNLLADRWALEAFASYYALEAAADLEVKAKGDELTDELRKSKIPLNAWGPIGREERATEDYAYAATLEVARQIAERAGEEGLQEVWQAAADKAGAYQPPAGTEATTAGTSGAGGTPDAAEPERVLGPPDWRGLIDLLEEHTDQTYEDLWREWIIRPEDAPLLAERAEAREHYDAVIDEAAGWSLPRPIRDAMRAWQFDTAGGLLDEAAAVLEQRDAIARAAADADLTPPDNLRTAFEGKRWLRRCPCRDRPAARRHRSLRRRRGTPTGEPGRVHAARPVRGNSGGRSRGGGDRLRRRRPRGIRRGRRRRAADLDPGGGRRADPRGGHRPDRHRDPPARHPLDRRHRPPPPGQAHRSRAGRRDRRDRRVPAAVDPDPTDVVIRSDPSAPEPPV